MLYEIYTVLSLIFLMGLTRAAFRDKTGDKLVLPLRIILSVLVSLGLLALVMGLGVL
jgi:hypothetical protein